MIIEELRNRYVDLFGLEPTECSGLDLIETELGVELPEDFKNVMKFYSGGMLGGISHNSLATIMKETKRLRGAVGLPHSFVVLAEPPVSLIVLNTKRATNQVVIWCDGVDVSRLGTRRQMHNPQTWESYAEFFRFLIDTEEQERREG